MIPRSLTSLAVTLLLIGCGVPVVVNEVSGTGGFPHEEAYSRVHMEYAEQDDTGCFQCHAVDEESLTEDQSPLHCSLCHDYPPIPIEIEE